MSFDQRDLLIIEELNIDARQSARAIARKLGMTRATVRYRLNQLIERHALVIACVPGETHSDQNFLILIGIKVTPGMAEAVANLLVPLPEVRGIFLSAGRYQVLTWIYLKNSAALEQFISETLAKLSDINDFETMHSYQWVTKSWQSIEAGREITQKEVQYVPNDLDLSIIEAIQRDPRQSIAALAKTVGCAKLTAKARLDRLLDAGIIRFIAAADHTVLGYTKGVAILIKCKPEKIKSVANELLAQSTVTYVHLITGQWHIYVRALFQGNEDIYNFLANTLNRMAGIIAFEVLHLGKTIKTSTSLINSA